MFAVNINHLAARLGISLQQLTYLLYKKNTENCYFAFGIKKKDGTLRTINAPNNKLKKIQQRLATLLYQKEKEIRDYLNISPNISHGFEKDRSIKTNAKVHINKKFVLNIYLKDFFNSFHFGRVRGYFNKNKNFNLDIDTATIVAQLTRYKGSLPQGAPTSPIISNLICQVLDFKLLTLVKKFRLDYTRYADDLTFSTNDKNFIYLKEDFMKEVSAVIQKSGFVINAKKTRLQYKDSRQTVTGLVVNKKINVDKRYFRLTKAMAHSLYTKGEFFIDGVQGSINQLDGRFSFINQVDKYENENCAKEKRNFFNLNTREKEYQKFLFYKWFLHNDNPVIITEGETDPIYIKAALKNICEKDPSKYSALITKNDNGKFEFKIRFFDRNKQSDKLKYFFNISKEGADTLSKLYNFYSDIDNHNYKNYNIFFNKYGTTPLNPIILIFDNELFSKKKPLKNFNGYIKLNNYKKNEFKNDQKIKLIDQSNLYLITTPLVNGSDESEIEDLFSEVVLNTKIQGRKFDRKVEKGDSNHYGKKHFANFVMGDYRNIDFSNFIPFLDNIDTIVREYNI